MKALLISFFDLCFPPNKKGNNISFEKLNEKLVFLS